MQPFRDSAGVARDAIADHLSVVRRLESQQDALQRAAAAMSEAILNGKTIFWFGNGGSAADAQHLAAELVGRFRIERRAVASVALTADTSVLTAIANDYGYHEVFSRQLEALCAPQDVAVGISSSGNSVNVCFGLQTARDRGAFTVALTGESGGRMASVAHVSVQVPSRDTARIQEAHILCGHILCEWLEAAVTGTSCLAALGSAK